MIKSILFMPKNIREADLHDKKILLRVDFNVPFDLATGEILDDTRIRSVIPTIDFLVSQGARLTILSHLGRPKYESDKNNLSFERLLPSIQALFSNFKISFIPDLFDSSRFDSQQANEIFLFENIRFHKTESDADTNVRLNFAKQIATNFEIYVNDAFSVCHREQASITEIPKFLPSYMGFLLEEEIKQLQVLRENIKRPYVTVIGGSKVSTKIKTLKSLIKTADTILIGGAMAYTFLKSRALEIGNSLFERDYLSVAFQIVDEAIYYKKELLLPIDHLIAKRIDNESKVHISKRNIPVGFLGGDIGPKTLKIYVKKIKSAKTIFWNGPMGVFEIPEFSKGTVIMAKSIANAKAQSVVGGGDSIHALKVAGVTNEINHISGGGGAALAFLENPVLPGIQALNLDES